jgi:hypothetical protein
MLRLTFPLSQEGVSQARARSGKSFDIDGGLAGEFFCQIDHS